MAILQDKIRGSIQRLQKSKEGKKLLKNFSYLSILEMTTHLFPLLTTPYLARVVGVNGFGCLAVGVATVAYFQSFTNYGFVYTLMIWNFFRTVNFMVKRITGGGTNGHLHDNREGQNGF